jgi:transcriptional regulator with XRE-family HTH domain
MIPLVREKQRAIELRKKGYSYRDILKELKVSKSSISLWLQQLPLTEQEKKYLKSRRDSNISLGRIRAATTNHGNRLKKDQELFNLAKEEFHRFSADPFFHVGVGLYWAEGSKRTSSFQFMNSDEGMIDVMLLWIERFFAIPRRTMKVRLYIHKPYAHENCESWWSRKISVPLANFQKTIYKPTGLLVKKRPDYKGCLRIEIGTVTHLRKMKFWQSLLLEHYQKYR